MTVNQSHYLVNHFQKAASENHCKQLKSAGEFLMKGKSMSEKKKLKRFFFMSASELCILELRESYCEKKAKEHPQNENEEIHEAIFCSQTHIQPLLSHSHTDKTVQKKSSLIVSY